LFTMQKLAMFTKIDMYSSLKRNSIENDTRNQKDFMVIQMSLNHEKRSEHYFYP